MPPIRYEHAIDVKRTPDRVFAVLDDFAQTPKWVTRCTKLEKVSPGPNAVGDKLKYDYKEGGRSGTMDGEITARTPGEHLSFRYGDKMMDVIVDFKLAKTAEGTHLVHAFEITPKTFMAKLFAPMIRRSLPKQTNDSMETLRGLIEGAA